MPLDKQSQAMVDQLNAPEAPKIEKLAPPQARETFNKVWPTLGGTPAPVAKIENREIPGPAGKIPVRIYTPEGPGPFPVLVYFHGGGWVICSLDTHEPVCRALTAGAGCVTVSVDYRLAPEHKFPAAPNDSYAATKWVADNAASLNCNPAHLAVGGDSSGGNLAAVVCLMARERGGPKIAFQLLIYPATDSSFEQASHRELAEGYFLTRSRMMWFYGHYLTDQDKLNPYACPLRANDLKGLPPALVITAEFDPLRDEGEDYGRRLRAAGVPVTVSRYDGTIHGFISMAGVIDKGKRGLEEASAALRTYLR